MFDLNAMKVDNQQQSCLKIVFLLTIFNLGTLYIPLKCLRIHCAETDRHLKETGNLDGTEVMVAVYQRCQIL